MTREEEIKNEAKLKCHDIASEVDYISSAAYDGFVMGAEWADKTMIEKACKWLSNNLTNYESNMMGYIHFSQIEEIIKDFRKAMEE